jgi:cell division protein FtsL
MGRQTSDRRIHNTRMERTIMTKSEKRTITILIGIALLCTILLFSAAKKSYPVEKPVAAGLADIVAYNDAYTNSVIAISGNIKGVGGNQYTRFMDIATPNTKGVKSVRCYFDKQLTGKEMQVIAIGKLQAPGNLKLQKLIILVNDPPMSGRTK